MPATEAQWLCPWLLSAAGCCSRHRSRLEGGNGPFALQETPSTADVITVPMRLICFAPLPQYRAHKTIKLVPNFSFFSPSLAASLPSTPLPCPRTPAGTVRAHLAPHATHTALRLALRAAANLGEDPSSGTPRRLRQCQQPGQRASILQRVTTGKSCKEGKCLAFLYRRNDSP